MSTGSSPSESRHRFRDLARKLSVAAVSFLFCASLFEVVLRLAGYGNLEIYDPDPSLYWKLKPGQHCYTKVDHKPVRINSHSTRGPEFLPAKPPGTFRILSLGDSRTFGWGLAESETYSARLQQLLQEHFGASRRVEVINSGVNAWSYPQMLVYLRDTALRYQPDAVILAEANLWTQFSENNSPEFVRRFMGRVRLKNLLRRSAIYHYAIELKLKAFYERHRTKFIPVDPAQDALFKEQQRKDPDAVFRSAIEGICTLALSNGARPVLLSLPVVDDLTSTNLSRIQLVKRDVCRRLGVALVDLDADLRPEGKAAYLEADPVHLNARGNELVARRLLEALK
ncbi:MAG TPA: SGNH/GDSL hydrolase family protein [Verrucomicrobiota bacterium]|nr:SGNH/GDSL hydrolase family protein [Verrucomicrobiota bacterium]HQL77736.1 SGNH/GDSL hydrolase family protein [Verrucomicrobiota bacterium]